MRQPSISATQIEPEPLEVLAELFGGRVRFSTETKGGNDAHTWGIFNAGSVGTACEELMPFLVNKRREAEVVGRFCSVVKRGRRELSDEETGIRIACISKMDGFRSEIKTGDPKYKKSHPRKKSPCGTDAKYQRGCRCRPCRDATNARKRDYLDRKRASKAS